MIVHRITKSNFANDLSGDGSRKYGGRWNSVGIPILYTSEHISLAVLEILAHTTSNLLPKDLVLISLEIPEKTTGSIINSIELPTNWNAYPASRSTQMMGDEWTKKSIDLFLKVPSVFVPEEYNVIINCNHSDFRKIKIKTSRPFSLNNRLI